MKLCAVIFVLCYAVAVAQDKNDGDDRWIWRGEETTVETDYRNQETNTTTSTTPTPLIANYNISCSFPIPPKPSFSAPGRRTCDEKCEEYKWDKVMSEISITKTIECVEEKNRINGVIPQEAVGGRPTFLGEFPHMGAVGWAAVAGGYVFKCGSTLISANFVLTAAHCSSASSADTTLADVVPKVIRLSDKNLFEVDGKGIVVTEDVNISRIIVHPDYKPPKKYFDIALMELQYAVDFSWLVQPACLWTKDDVSELGPDATLTGWGVLSPGSIDISPELQAAEVNIFNNTYCDQLLFGVQNRNFQGVRENQLCAGKLSGGVDACQGDSGGPLQVKQNIKGTKESVYHVIGVTSFGIGCALPNFPGIYTRVSSFTDWIEGNVWPSD